MGADKNEYAGSSFSSAGGSGSAGGTNTMGVDKSENIDSSSGDVAADGVSESAEKQLKVSKSQILVTVINHKRPHLLKKTIATKFP